MKYTLEYNDQIIELPPGESLVGRARGCRLRFTDLAVSRVHCRLTVSGSGIVIEDLGSQSGTVVNDGWLQGPRPLEDGDSVQIGSRRFRIRKHDWHQGHEITARDSLDGPTTKTREFEELPTDVSLIAGAASADPQPAQSPSSQPASTPRPKSVGADTAESIFLDPKADLPRGLQRRPTLPVPPQGVKHERRRHIRIATEIQVLYSSDELTFRGLVRDLSASGMFIASDLLDPPGTTCCVEVFPEGQCTVQLTGTVRRVVTTAAGSGGRPPGVGIEFMQPGEEAKTWLEGILANPGQ